MASPPWSPRLIPALIRPEKMATSIPLLEIELGDGLLLLLFGQFALLAHAGRAHQRDADQRDDNADRA